MKASNEIYYYIIEPAKIKMNIIMMYTYLFVSHICRKSRFKTCKFYSCFSIQIKNSIKKTLNQLEMSVCTYAHFVRHKKNSENQGY